MTNALTVGLIGNPNAGKTTLFNRLTGAHQRVGNWPGVTVERKQGAFETAHHAITLIDLPGIYSLTAIGQDASLDERIACNFLLETTPDVILNVVDGSNLERNLYLTVQLRELGLPCVVALNMLDLARAHGRVPDAEALSQQLGCPVIPLVSTRGEGIDALKQALDTVSQPSSSALKLDYTAPINAAIKQLTLEMPDTLSFEKKRWLALQLLEGDLNGATYAGRASSQLNAIVTDLTLQQVDAPLQIVDTRYQHIGRVLETAYPEQPQAAPQRFGRALDTLVLNRWLGLPCFLLVMYVTFLLAINIGGALQPIFDQGSVALFVHGTQWLGYTLSLPEALTVFLAQGIGGGLNTVLPLIPQIGLMYLCLSFLEDSGYMARAAFVIDRLMQALGLPGKSFVPLIVGFGCNVPAIMGARTLNAPRERLMTIMMAPFMSCGARLAIFAVFASAFFGQHGASIVFSLYLLGIVVALLTGLLLKYTLLRGEAQPFVMELPPYHTPHLKGLLIQTWLRLRGFLLRAGKVIVCASIVIGGLNSFSLQSKPVEGHVEQSALASISQTITPLFSPFGIHHDHWQATVGLVTGAMAKEVVVGTLNTLYTAESLQEHAFDPADFHLGTELSDALAETWDGLLSTFSLSTLGNPIEASMGDGEMDEGAMGIMAEKFGGAVPAYAYLIFVLLYVPCASVLGAIAREAGNKWMMFSIFWGISAAYSIATLFYQAATFTSHVTHSAVLIACVLGYNALLLGVLRYLATHQRSASTS